MVFELDSFFIFSHSLSVGNALLDYIIHTEKRVNICILYLFHLHRLPKISSKRTIEAQLDCVLLYMLFTVKLI